MSAVINNEYQTALLFKQFTGVAATQLNSQFSNEPFRAIVNIFSRDVFIEDIPDQAPISIYNLDNSANWADSDSSGNPSDIGGSSGSTFATLYPDSKLQFYKNVKLDPVPGSQSRVWRKLDSNGNNILRDCINFKYDDVNSTYLMRVKYSTSPTAPLVYLNNSINSWPLFWVMDNQSGYLQFYSTTTDLATNASIPANSPKISFFKYIGKKGITNLDVSGQQQVADISGIDTMLDGINRMILPDGYVDIIGGAPYDLCGNEVVRTHYQYTRNHAFIGYPNLPILDGSAVDHSFDPSHNIQGISNELFHLDVSGDCYVSQKIVVGVSGGFYIESNSGDTHIIGSSEEGDMEFSSSNHVAIHVQQQQNAFYVASSGSVGVGTADPSAKLEVNGNTLMGGELDMSCNNIVDVSRISFCPGGLLDLSCNPIVDVSRISFCNGSSVTNASIYWETDKTTGIYSPTDVAVGITCSGEKIATFSGIDASGIEFFRDLSMNGGQITFIGDATDSSGVPSWGQVQQAIIDGSGGSSQWDLSGSNIYNNNGGNVGIGTDSPSQALEVSGTIVLWGDLSMNGGQITFIGDATDSSGVPSWGQVQQAITDGSGGSSQWDLSGSNIYNNNGGNVGIGTDSPSQALEVSGTIVLWGDLSMNGGQITFIGDATDSSGVPSWGQVQQAITDGSGGSSQWDLSGSNIYNNNGGNVGIGTANPAVKLDVVGGTNIAGDTTISKSSTLSAVTVDKNLYVRDTNIVDTLKIGFNTFFTDIWEGMLQKNLNLGNNGDPTSTPTFDSALGPTLIPLAYIDINQNYIPGQPLIDRPYIANATAYFTIKFAEPPGTQTASQQIHWDQAQTSNEKSFLGGLPEQTIHFVAGYIDNYQDINELRNPKPFIKILSTNIINQKCLTGITVDGGGAADILLLTNNFTSYYQSAPNTPKIGGISRIVIAEGLPSVPADKDIQNKVWLCLEQTWNHEPWQGSVNKQALTDMVSDHIIDVKMYNNNTGDLSTLRNPAANPTNTDWQLVKEEQIQSGQIFGWEKFILPMGINTSPSNIFNMPTLPATAQQYTLQVGGTPPMLAGYPYIYPNANLWEVWLNLKNWPYGITTTEEVFENNVDICGNLLIDGNTNAKDIYCENIDVSNSMDVGANQELRITESTITSTTLSTNFSTGLVMEANNFYHKVNTPGIGSGFIINLNYTNDDKMFRIMQGTNWSTDKIFTVGAYGTTSTREIRPMTDLSYNIGYDQGPGSSSNNRNRFKQLHIGDISCSFTIDTSGDLIVKGNGYFKNNVDICGNLTVDGTTDLNGDVDICGNVDICGDVDIAGTVDICGNVDISGGLRVSLDVDICGNTTIDGVLTAPTIQTVDLSGTNIDLAAGGMFRLKDNYTGAASNHVVVARADQNKVNFGGYDYTGGTGIIGTKTGRNRVVVDLEAGATQFVLNVADSGSVIQTLGGIKMLPLQSNVNGAPPNYASPGWGASLFLGEWGWGNQSWNNLLSIRLSQRTVGQNFPGSGNVYCNAVRQNIVYSDLNVQGPTWNAGYQGPTSNTMYYNQGDIRYIVVDPTNGSSNLATVILPEIQSPMLGQSITVTRANVPTTYTGHKTAVYIRADTPDRINCPSSIFVGSPGDFGAIALDPFNDLSGNSSVDFPIPYKGTEICSVTLVASQNGYYNEIPNSSGEPQGGAITTQFVWQFISSGSPGI